MVYPNFSMIGVNLMDIGGEISWAQKCCTAAISAKIQCDVVRGAGKMAGKSSQIGRS